jgi:hypothetical protein
MTVSRLGGTMKRVSRSWPSRVISAFVFRGTGSPAVAAVARSAALGRSMLVAGVVVLAACSKPAPVAQEAAESAAGPAERAPAVNVMNVRAVGMKFEGPTEVPSGWVTIRLENASGMAHFAVVERLPEGVTVARTQAEVAPPFQRGLDALNAGDPDAANAAFGQLPDWFGQVVFLGGPGLLSGGRTGETTVFLEPGNYMLECYVKTNGVFHSYNPEPGEFGMVHGFTVTEAVGGMPEPESNATLAVSTQGFQITSGDLNPGTNILKVEFADQQAYPNFVGHDVHVARLGDGVDPGKIAAWMDWRQKDGLQTPAPAVFVGGVNDMPAGSTAYLRLELEPGDYAFVAEVPSPDEQGLLLPFSVGP